MMEDCNVKVKVAAFIIRTNRNEVTELLVHSFVALPTLPLRVPGGSVDDMENPEQALYREVLEESGLENLQLIRKLGVQSYYKPYIQANVERHDFLLRILAETLDVWEYCVKGLGADAGEIFRYRWIESDQLSSMDLEYYPFITPNYLWELFRRGY